MTFPLSRLNKSFRISYGAIGSADKIVCTKIGDELTTTDVFVRDGRDTATETFCH